ncbi:hypothetical protein MCUN1_000284 [Malassezia cuniculi]|uniref:Uncharacterized protein n=1 Tax=Malassezia cuniculi TaxID=948313 RepID=A0AAF0ENA6_9BASI|nr:hypothetical protein MCUN1_000284 [Malassezia cuniculi]
MPHKRAKLSTRRAQRESTGVDLAPKADRSKERDMPRSAMLVFRQPPPPSSSRHESSSKASSKESDAKDSDAEQLRIRPGEKISAFNRRVESAFATKINETARKENRSESNKRKRQKNLERLRAKKLAKDPIAARRAEEALDFKKAPTTRSVREVAEAPPTLTARPKIRKPRDQVGPSPARQRILDEERERVVQQYRALKKSRIGE